MNKPLKLLLVIGVLAFAAAGLYYAMVSPSRGGKAETPLTRRDQSGGAKIADGDTRTPTVVVGKEPAGSWPSPLPSEKPSVPAEVPVAPASAAAPATSTPPGSAPAPEPMKPLPSSLPGFDPVRADGGAAKGTSAPAITPGSPAPSTAPATSAPAITAPSSGAIAPSPATQATPPSTAPTGVSTTAKPAGDSALPPLPAPAKPAVTPAPAPAMAPTPAATTKAAKAQTYTVKEGDSIASIWRELTGSERGWEKLLAANPGVDPSRMKIGQVLKVPDLAAAPAGGTSPAPAATKPATGAGTYTVESGDTLSRIAAKTLGDSKRWKEIFEANRDALGNDPGALKVGQSLKIPGKASTKPAAPATGSSPAPR